MSRLPTHGRVAFMSTRNGSQDIFEAAANGTGDVQPLLVREDEQVPWSWTPDGKILAFTDGIAVNSDIWLLPRGGSPKDTMSASVPVDRSHGASPPSCLSAGARLAG